jgi:RNA polymerase sigma-70 factor (ECF subfamily)
MHESPVENASPTFDPSAQASSSAEPFAPTPASRAELRRGLVTLGPELAGRALRLTRSEAAAADLVQDTLERAMRFEDHYRPGTNLRAYLHQILFSVFVTGCRRKRRERAALERLGADPNAWTVPPAVSEPCTLGKGAREELAKLPVSFRHVVLLVDLDERSYRDAASALGVPVGTVMSRLHRARKLLAEGLSTERTLHERAAA